VKKILSVASLPQDDNTSFVMARPTAILFDLDGTLIDSIELILKSAHYAFEGYSKPAPSDAEWLSGVGTPLVEMFRRYATDPGDVEPLIARYREYQFPNHDRLVHAYDGVVDTVKQLRAAQHPLAVVTSKTEVLARRGIDLVGIGDCFDVVIGCDSTERHKPHPEPVLVALDQLGRSPSEAVFVGDSVHDMASGNAAGVATIAALWGPFTRADLEPSDPRHWLERIEDLPAMLGRLTTGKSGTSA
jgi:pyrophosphatase PpaX